MPFDGPQPDPARYTDRRLYHAAQREDGAEFEDYASTILAKHLHLVAPAYKSRRYQLEVGESIGRVEYKLDRGCIRYGHLSIEIGECPPGAKVYVPSGILRKDNSIWYCQGCKGLLYLFAKETLLRYYSDVVLPQAKQRIHEFPTLQAFHLNFDEADRCMTWRYTGRQDTDAIEDSSAATQGPLSVAVAD